MILYFRRNAWNKILAYTDNCDCEIGGMGQLTSNGVDFFVEDVEIYKQRVTPGTVDLSAETLALWQVEKIKAKQSLSRYTLFWHSHAKMGVFFSQTDKDTINGSTEFPYLVSLVINHKHETTARLDIFKPVRVYVEKLDVKIIEEVDANLIELCKQEIEDKVEFPKPPVIPAWTKDRDGKWWNGTQEVEKKDDLEAVKTQLELEYEKLEARYQQLESQPQSRRVIKAMESLDAQMSEILFRLDQVS
jgi:hypothetical protein